MTTPDMLVDRSRQVGPYSCFGQRWEIVADDAALLELLDDLFEPLRADPGSAGPVVEYRLKLAADGRGGEVHRDGESIGGGKRPERVLGKLIWAINRQVIDNIVDRLTLHAAAAAETDGRVVLLPAPMESGKTTLVTGLLDRGLDYLTDEAAAIDADLTVHGYSKPLSIDPGSWDVLRHHQPRLDPELAAYMERQWQVPAHRITTVRPHGQLSLVVFPTFEAGAPTTFERLDPVTALDLARTSTFGVEGQPLPAEKVAALAQIVVAVPCYRLHSGDLDAACRQVLRALGSDDHHGR